MTPQLLPESTYRLQFHVGFTFRDAARLAPYLRDLGVTHVYASPYLKARPGSTHGYDIADHGVLNPEVGTPEDHDAFVAALREHGLGLILDIVPNHMGVATNDNPWWNDVLENGPSSRYADHFDITWKGARPELEDKVLLPVLGEPFGDVLESGQLKLSFESGVFTLHYFERRLPVAPRSYARVLSLRQEELAERLGTDSPDLAEYQSILTAIGHLPDRTDTDPGKRVERRREKEVVKRRLGELVGRSEVIRQFVEESVARFNGTPGDPRSFDHLDGLLAHQCYRLSFWRVATDEINYRRFFDVNDLAALSMEREEVFAAAHELVFRLFAEGKVDGLRIDHPDGLYDPKQYFDRLQQRHAALGRSGEPSRRPAEVSEFKLRSPDRPTRPSLYVVAEKILGANESLPGDWAVHGTSGYEFLVTLNGLFVDGSAEVAFTRLYRELLGGYTPFAEVVYWGKRLVLSVSLASELNMLALQLDRLAQKGRRSRDFTLTGLRDALREVIACFPVYRSYIADGEPTETDRRHVEVAARRAAVRNRLTSPSVFHFIRDTVLQVFPDGATDSDKAEQRRFAGKFQQVTSPVMAKGVEDTAFYLYHRLVSLNEVGGDPGAFGTPPGAVHKFFADRQAHWPYALSPLSTHDTKRSEDVRARLNVLSEIPDEWGAAVRRWMALNADLRLTADGAPVPDANDEYLLYQTLLGVWPPGAGGPDGAFTDRIKAYMLKALREAKVRTSWVNPNAEYDAAVQEFVGRLLDPQTGSKFLDDFRPFQRQIAWFGAFNSLSQTVLKITAPGVPDTYQGTELPDFSLVDPDNRRPVDYDRRRALLEGLKASASGDDLSGYVRGLIDTVEDGRAKLYLTWRALHARQSHPGLFAEGEYLPMTAEGAKAEHVFAFTRRLGDATAMVVVTRLPAKLTGDPARLPVGMGVWGNTRLPATEGQWRDVFTGRRFMFSGDLPVADLFADLPVTLLLRVG